MSLYNLKMEGKDKLKEINIKNRTCYYFDDIIKDVYIYLNDFIRRNVIWKYFVYDISYKTSTGPKPLRIGFDKIDGFIRVRGGEFIYLVLLDHG